MQMDVDLWLEIFSAFQPSKRVFNNKERGTEGSFFHRKSLKTKTKTLRSMDVLILKRQD